MKYDALTHFYPERRIAGFSRNDARIIFYSQVNALLRPDMRVLDFGAGRGKWAETESGFKLALTTLRGKCREVVGADVDDAVTQNPLVDRSVVLDPSENLPFDDESFDLIVSWAVFEHIRDPELCASELARILKPGGWICAWTPCKWGYFSVGARLIPARFHSRVIHAVQRGRKDEDIFPTAYRLNTMSALRAHFPDFDNHSYYFNGAPSYCANKVLFAWIWKAWMTLLPEGFSQQLHVFMRRKLHP